LPKFFDMFSIEILINVGIAQNYGFEGVHFTKKNKKV